MDDLTLKASTREVVGKRTRFLRRQGITPIHLFGHKIKSLTLECDTEELIRVATKAGTTTILNLEVDSEKRPRKVLIREVQMDAFGRELLHVDFYQVKKTEKMTADIPIILVGEAPAVKSKENMVEQLLTHLGVSCLPDKIPPQIEVDISNLEEAGQAIHVSDISLDPEITVTTDAEQPVVKISRVRAAAALEAEEAAEEAAEAAEGEAEEAAEAPAAEETTEQEG